MTNDELRSGSSKGIREDEVQSNSNDSFKNQRLDCLIKN